MAVIVNPDPTANDLDGNTAQSQPDSYFGKDEVDEGSEFQDVLRFPIYYDGATDNDETNGRAVLCDCLTANVTMTYNQAPTAQFTYPRNGIAAKIIKPEHIIMTDCDQDTTHQKFRIDEVLKEGDHLTINAHHIIGDLEGATLSQNIQLVNATAATLMTALLDPSNVTDDLPDIRFDTDVAKVSNVDIDSTSGNHLSNYIFDADAEGDTATQSLVGLFGGELLADNYHLIHRKHIGRDTGIVVKYGGRIQTVQQDENIQNTYTAIFPYAKYTPGQAVANLSNTDWTNWATDWTNIGSVTYTAGGSVGIYDAPVAGAHKIGELSTGKHLKLGKPVSDGSFTPDGKFQINTTNGDTWYPIWTQEGGGWIDGTWVNFSKTGDYLVNDATGYVHTAIPDSDSKMIQYPVSGTGTVNWNSGKKKIQEFNYPDPNPDNKKRGTGKYLKYGTRFKYKQVSVDENGDKWYQLTNGKWIYGPHVKVNSEQDITHYASHGEGYVKKNAVAYHIDKHGMMVPKTHKGKLVSTRKKKKPKTVTVWRGKGKKRHKVKKKTYYYGKTRKCHKQVKTHLRRSHYKLNRGQALVSGTIYYAVSKNTYVKSSSIDWNAKYSKKPTLPKDIIKTAAQSKGVIEVYSAPTKNAAANWTIPIGVGLEVDHTADGADGNTWYEVTYKGKTGFIPADLTDTSADGDLEPTAKDTDDTTNGLTKDATVDQSEVLVKLGDGQAGLVFPENAGNHEVQRVLNVDLSAYIQHNDQDLSGQQPDGSFVATDDDKAQLLTAAKNYVIEHRIGEPVTSLTVSYAQSDDIEGDLTALHLYDIVTVYYEQLGINVKAQVSSTTYDALAHHFTQITIGEIPKTWQHLLVEAANKQTNELQEKVRVQADHTSDLFSQIGAALTKEGEARLTAENKIAKKVGLIDETTGKLVVNYQTIDKQMQAIDQNVQEVTNSLLSGGSAELQFLDASGSSNFIHPTQIKANNSDGTSMIINSNGIGFYDSYGNKTRAGFDHNGYMVGDYISAGTINSLTIKTCTIDGALQVGQGTDIAISVGTEQPPDAHDSPSYGGNGIWLVSGGGYTKGGYENMISSGRISIHHGNDTLTLTGANGITWNGRQLKKSITVGKQTYSLWD